MATAAPVRSGTGSDLQPADVEELAPKKASRQILQHEIDEELDALRRPAVGLFVSGLSAGLDIGFSLFLMAVAMTHAEGAPIARQGRPECIRRDRASPDRSPGSRHLPQRHPRRLADGPPVLARGGGARHDRPDHPQSAW
jgi:hypothetical protein